MTLVFLILCSIVMGAYGMTADLPYSRAAVEIAVVGMSVKLGTGDLNPHIFYYPHLFMYILFFLYGLFFILGKIIGIFPSVQEFQNLYFTDASAFYIIARSATLFFMAGSVLLTFVIAKRAFNKKIALVAAALITFNITMVQLSHYALSDIPVLFFSLLAFSVIVKIMEGARLRIYLLSGFLIGLATATKYQALFLVFSLILAHILSFENKKDVRNIIFTNKLPLSFAGVFGGFFIGSPFCILDYKNFMSYFTLTAKAVSSPSYGFASYRITRALPLYIITDLLPYAAGILLSVFCVAAIVYALKKHTKSDILFLGTIFVFLIYVIASGWTYLKPRHIIHLFPLFFILIGRLLYDACSAIFKEETRKNAFLVCMTVLVLIPSFRHIWIYEKNITSKPVHIEAKEWIESNIPASTKIATQDGIPIEPNERSIKRKLKEITEKNIGQGTKLKVMLTNRDLFDKTYDIYELPYPWRRDYDESDFDFDRHTKEGVRFFVFTNELSNYLAEPEKHSSQLGYYNSVKKNCVLRKKLTSRFLRSGLGAIKENPYVLIYEYKKGVSQETSVRLFRR